MALVYSLVDLFDDFCVIPMDHLLQKLVTLLEARVVIVVGNWTRHMNVSKVNSFHHMEGK